MQVPSCPPPQTTAHLSAVIQALASEDARILASAVLDVSEVKEELLKHFLCLITEECMELCKKGPSKFRTIPVNQFVDFQWKDFVTELEEKSPILLKVLTAVVTRADRRCERTPKTNKHPGIITAAAILLKQRNREMCGIPSLVSLLMYAGHCEKQVRATD